MNTTEIVAAIAAFVPLAIAIINDIFDYFRNKTGNNETYNRQLFDNVLIPLLKILKGKNETDIDDAVFKEMEKIYSDNFLLIPRHMEMMYNILKKQYVGDGIDSLTYQNYYKYIDLTFIKIRKKLGYPTNNYFIYYLTTSIGERIVWTIIFPLYCLLGLIFVLNEMHVAFFILIFLAGILTYAFMKVDELIVKVRARKRRRKIVLKKNNDECIKAKSK